MLPTILDISLKHENFVKALKTINCMWSEQTYIECEEEKEKD